MLKWKMPNSSFEIKTSADLFNALQDMIADYRNDQTSSRKAIAAFMFAYHLRQWLWKEHQVLVVNILRCRDEAAFNALVNNQYPNFRLIREICNGSKHFGSNGSKHFGSEERLVDSSGLTGGEFSSGFSSGFKIGKLTVTTGSKTIPAMQLLSEIMSYYEQIFSELGLS